MVTSVKPAKDAVRTLLDWELSLDSSDLRSHAWYHGNISRARAESLVADQEGHFLVRDCSSKADEYVLTCYCNHSILHFVINRQVLPPYQQGFPDRIQYSFEDDSFDTVPDLITYCVGNQRPISFASGAIISCPVNREIPLSWTNEQEEPERITMVRSESRSSIDSLNRYQKSVMRVNVSTVNSNCPVSGKISANKANNLVYSRQTRSKYSLDNQTSPQQPPTSAPLPPPSSNKVEPIYVNSEVYQQFLKKRESEDFAYFSDYSDKDGGSSGKYGYTTLIISSNYSLSRIDPVRFHTFLLPKNNKPLDGGAINKIKSTILETGSRLLANHVTRIDLEFIYHAGGKCDLGLGLKSGLELLVLPQGDRYREDFLDRSKCFQYFMATSILTCQSEKERAAMMDKWIQIGIECKTGLGNLMAFAGIMIVLSSPPITRLKRTWLTLRQCYTSNAVTFESKLKPVFKGMKECREPFAPNTTFPFILPSVEIIHRHYALSRASPKEPCNRDASVKVKNVSLDLDLETMGSDYGLELIFSHLDNCRQIVSQSCLFQRNAQILFEDVALEELLLDMFRTEFHRRFLWGTKGSNVDLLQRYEKYEHLLDLLSQKCELD